MWNVPICLFIYLCCISLTPVTPVEQAMLMRRLESLTIRMEILEINLRKEQKTSETLQAVVKELRTEIFESRSRISTGKSGKICGTVVQKTSEIIRNDLQSVRHGLVVEKTRGIQLVGSQQECKERVIKTEKLVKSLGNAVEGCKEHANNTDKLVKFLENAVQECKEHANKTDKLVKSLENAVQECKEHANKTDSTVSSFENSVEDIRINMSRLSEDMSELKINWTVRPNPGPEQGGGEVLTDTATCSRCLQGAETSLSNLVNIACQKNISYLYLVKVKHIKEEPLLRKIYTDVEDAFGKDGRRLYRSTTVVLMESRTCFGCSRITPGTTYLIMAQNPLNESSQHGSRFEFPLNDRSFHTRFTLFSGRSQPIADKRLAAILSEFMRLLRGTNWSRFCKLYGGKFQCEL